MGNLVTKMFIFTVVLLSVTNSIPWSECYKFKDDFHFSSFKSNLEIDDAIHNDMGINNILVRIYHNKPVYFSLDNFTILLRFIDITYLTNLISLSGVLGSVLGIRYIFMKKRLFWGRIIVSFIIITGIAETYNLLKITLPAKLLFLSLPFYFLIYYGYTNYFRKRRSILELLFILTILFISIWWQFLFLKNEIYAFCN